MVQEAELTGLRVLVLEDDFLVAAMIADLLQDWGCHVTGPVARVSGAVELAGARPLDGALLDIDLRGEFCFAAAAVLRRRDIPFFFVTGYDDGDIIPAEYRSVPRLKKPIQPRVLAGMMAEHFSHH